jgi:2-keto-3-deoxy-L-rhamnonate aldolase RhmA
MKDGMPYPEWWNKNGILGFKIETVKGVLLSRYLAKEGIDFIDFGGQDLSWDLNLKKHPKFKTIDDCRAFVTESIEGTGVKFGF